MQCDLSAERRHLVRCQRRQKKRGARAQFVLGRMARMHLRVGKRRIEEAVVGSRLATDFERPGAVLGAHNHAPPKQAPPLAPEQVYDQLRLAAVEVRRALGVEADEYVQLATLQQLQSADVRCEHLFPQRRHLVVEQRDQWTRGVQVGQRKVVVLRACVLPPLQARVKRENAS